MVKLKGTKNRLGSPVRGEDFFGRERFMELIWERIDNGNIILVAPRRFGKTSVMYRLIDEPRDGAKIVHADLESITSATDFIVQLLEAVSGDEQLNMAVRSIDFISGAWKSFKDTFEELGLYAFKIKLRENIQEDWQSKGQAIFEKIAESDSPVIFVLDEFPMMLDTMIRDGKQSEVKALLHWFRSLRQSPKIHEKVRFLVAGSIGIDRILKQVGEIASINDFEKIKLAPFNKGTSEKFLQALCQTYKFPLDEEITEKILELVGVGVPYFIQIMFSELYKANFDEQIKIDLEFVEKIYKDKVLGVDCKTYFEHYYGRLGKYYEPAEEKAARKVLRELAITGDLTRDACYRIYKEQLGDRADLERFGDLLSELENDFYVTSQGDSFEFGSKLLRDWWLRHYGLTVD